MATRRDPSATGLLVRSLERDLRRRLALLQAALLDYAEGESSIPGPQRLLAFRKWVREKVDSLLLARDGFGVPWIEKYAREAYLKGVARSYDEMTKKELRTADFQRGARAEFMKALAGKKDKITLLSDHMFEEVKGLADDLCTRLSRILSSGLLKTNAIKITKMYSKSLSRDANRQIGRSLKEGFAKGAHPYEIAKEMQKAVKGLTKQKARTIARTEIIRAHAEGQLDSYEAGGLETVGLYAEWSTAKDARVCPLCEPMEGQQFTIDEARGLIPRHPNCRCAWVPSMVQKAKNQRTRDHRRALSRSILAERKHPKELSKAQKLRRAKKTSTWAGRALVRNAVAKMKARGHAERSERGHQGPGAKAAPFLRPH